MGMYRVDRGVGFSRSRERYMVVYPGEGDKIALGARDRLYQRLLVLYDYLTGA
jgi:hypothetical protein